MSMWGGRFQQTGAAEFHAFNDSLPFDYVLAPYDIQAGKAWATALGQADVLSPAEVQILQDGLTTLSAELAADPQAPVKAGAEDIHSWVEQRLTELVGETGQKLHTGRSRNDLVATDLRLWTLEQNQALQEVLLHLMRTLLEFAEQHQDVIMPGYTHLQRAQPVSTAHWALAYVEMLERDYERLVAAAERTSSCPLGCGALAGTGMPVDRGTLAAELGFATPGRNSLDAVSDRDFVVEHLAVASLNMVHLSRLCEDIIFYCSGEAGFFEPGDAISSGSSLMPQKKNPDVFELIRGKSGRVTGTLQAMLMTLKGLPLAYNKDLQEDKEGFFSAVSEWQQSLQVLAWCLPHLHVKPAVAREAAEMGYSNATDLADYMVQCGVPFRRAHQLSGQLVLQAMAKGQPLTELSLAELQAVCPDLDQGVYQALTLMAGLQQRQALGGTAPQRVQQALAQAWQRLLAREAALTDIRQAELKDVPTIARLIRYWAGQGEHLPRREEDIMQAIHTFAVAEVDGEVVGCGALYVYGTGLAEIRSLGLAPGQEGNGLGAELVQFLLAQARELGIAQVIVLTRVPAFFAKLGFVVTDKSRWPEKVMKDCEFCPRKHACDETGLEIWL